MKPASSHQTQQNHQEQATLVDFGDLAVKRLLSVQGQPSQLAQQEQSIAELANIVPHITGKYKSSIDTFGWSSSSKHIDVDIEGPRMIRRRNSQRYRWYPVCSLLNSLVEADSDCQDWSIKINSSRHGLLVGICLESKAKSHMFEGWYWAVVGHGHYLIWTGGATYSHHEASDNNRRQQFELKAGEVVRLQFISKAEQLIFSSGDQILWKCKVQPAPQGDSYRGCVYLNEGDSVDIVHQ